GPRRVAGKLGGLPGIEVAEDVRRFYLHLLPQARHFLVDVERLAIAGVAKLLDLRIQFGDGLFEIEEVGVHSLLFIARKRSSIPFRKKRRERRRMAVIGSTDAC